MVEGGDNEMKENNYEILRGISEDVHALPEKLGELASQSVEKIIEAQDKKVDAVIKVMKEEFPVEVGKNVAKAIVESEAYFKSSEENRDEYIKTRDLHTAQVIKEQTKVYKEVGNDLNSSLEAQRNAIQSSMEKVARSVNQLDVSQTDALNAQVPETLRVPTPQLLKKNGFLDEVSEEDAAKMDFSDEKFHDGVREWFERGIRGMEYYSKAFEEQQAYARFELAAFAFEYREETANLGAEMREKLERRRTVNVIARVWQKSLPEGIYNASQQVSMDALRSVFTVKGKYGENEDKPIVAEAFKLFEKKAHDIKEAQKEVGKAKNDTEKKKEAKLTVDKLKKELVSFYEQGDKDSNGETLEKRIENLRKKSGNLSDKELKHLKELEENYWAVRMAGKLWSITERAGYHDIKLNGTGDFFAGRDFNLVDSWLEKSGVSLSTKGIWTPEKGMYAKRKFNLKHDDFFTMLGKKMNPYDEIDPEDLDVDKLGTEEYWNELINGKVVENKYTEGEIDIVRVDQEAYSDHIFKFQMADDTGRSVLLGAGKFFHNPNKKAYIELIGAFKSLSETTANEDKKENYVATDRGIMQEKQALEENAKTVRHFKISDKQAMWHEVLERTIELGQSKDGLESLEDMYFYRASEIAQWVSLADENQLITTEQAKYFYDKYCSLRIPLTNKRIGMIPLISKGWQKSIAIKQDFVAGTKRDPFVKGVVSEQVFKRMVDGIKNKIAEYWKVG